MAGGSGGLGVAGGDAVHELCSSYLPLRTFSILVQRWEQLHVFRERCHPLFETREFANLQE